MEEGILREDLFYRLSVAPIEVPSLNKRGEDINDLVEYFLKFISKELGSNYLHLSSETLVVLQNYDWPGNVRQLKNIIEWLIIMYGNQENLIIKPSHLPPEILGYNEIKKHDNVINNFNLSLKDARKNFEENYLKEQLKRFKGNIAKTSTYIGMDRSALHRKLKELNININIYN